VIGGIDMPDGIDCGWYVQPTLSTDANNSMRIAREEIFGPVLTAIPYRDEEDAIAIANDSDYGLAGSVFTADADRGLAIAGPGAHRALRRQPGLHYGPVRPLWRGQSQRIRPGTRNRGHRRLHRHQIDLGSPSATLVMAAPSRI
jgi:hypothetical protein